MKNKKIKLTKQGKIFFIILILLIISLILGINAYQTYKYHQTYEYKFLQLNYTLEEYNSIKYLDNNKLDDLLTKEYNINIPKLINEKYFLYKNLDRYLNYINEHNDLSLNEIVSLVNVNRDRNFYEDIKLTDTSKKETMLVNKYYALDKDYEAENIVNLSSTYAYANQSLNEDAYNAFKNLANAAKEEGYTIVILSSYRTYESQEKLWTNRKNTSGTEKADAYAARAGSSEHETGYAIDVADYYDKNDSFKDTDAYQWMLNNSYKYGFILR